MPEVTVSIQVNEGKSFVSTSLSTHDVCIALAVLSEIRDRLSKSKEAAGEEKP